MSSFDGIDVFLVFRFYPSSPPFLFPFYFQKIQVYFTFSPRLQSFSVRHINFDFCQFSSLIYFKKVFEKSSNESRETKFRQKIYQGLKLKQKHNSVYSKHTFQISDAKLRLAVKKKEKKVVIQTQIPLQSITLKIVITSNPQLFT